MIKTFAKLAAVSTIVLISTSLTTSAANMLFGSYTNLTMGTLIPLWDVSGQYNLDDSDLGTLDLTLTNEPSGKYTGAGQVTADYTFDYKGYSILIDLSGPVTVSGDVSGSSKKPSVSMILDYSTNDIVLDNIYFKSIKEKFAGKFSLDSNNDELVGGGTIDLKADFKNPETDKYETKGGSKAIKDREFSLPADTTGNWGLVLNLTDDSATKYSGTASIVTDPAGNSVDFTVTGTYAAKTEKSTLTLKGPKGSDCNLILGITGDTLTIDSISGKAFGQTLSYKLKEPKD